MVRRSAESTLFSNERSTKRRRTRKPLKESGDDSQETVLIDAPGRALEIRKEQRQALEAAVACHLEVEAWHACRLSKKAVMPTIRKLRAACRGSIKCGWRNLTRHQKRAICENRSKKTVMELCDGTMPAVDYGVAGATRRLLSLKTAAELFRTEVLPTALAAGSRARYHPLWKGLVTFSIAHGALQEVMPASKDLVQAWALELMMLGGSPSLIRSSIAAVQSRHTDYGYEPPLNGKLEFKRLMKAVGSLQGTPRKQILPLKRSMLRRLMKLEGLTPAQNRNALITVLGTQLCCRVGEIKRLQVCDFLPGYDEQYSRRYKRAAAFRIRKRKQDQLRRGLYPRLLPGSTPRLCTIRRLSKMLRVGTRKLSPQCTKAKAPAARCPHCPPLFASWRLQGSEQKRMSRQQISGAVKSSLKLIGIDSNRVSGISMRRGGISAAIHARVPEPVLFLQSGHGAGIAARSYMVPEDPRVLYETARALRL